MIPGPDWYALAAARARILEWSEPHRRAHERFKRSAGAAPDSARRLVIALGDLGFDRLGAIVTKLDHALMSPEPIPPALLDEAQILIRAMAD